MLSQCLADAFSSSALTETEIQGHSDVYESKTNFFLFVDFFLSACTHLRHRCDSGTLTH